MADTSSGFMYAYVSVKLLSVYVHTHRYLSNKDFRARSVIFDLLVLTVLYFRYSVIRGVWEDSHTAVLPQKQW